MSSQQWSGFIVPLWQTQSSRLLPQSPKNNPIAFFTFSTDILPQTLFSVFPSSSYNRQRELLTMGLIIYSFWDMNTEQGHNFHWGRGHVPPHSEMAILSPPVLSSECDTKRGMSLIICVYSCQNTKTHSSR